MCARTPRLFRYYKQSYKERPLKMLTFSIDFISHGNKNAYEMSNFTKLGDIDLFGGWSVVAVCELKYCC